MAICLSVCLVSEGRHCRQRCSQKCLLANQPGGKKSGAASHPSNYTQDTCRIHTVSATGVRMAPALRTTKHGRVECHTTTPTRQRTNPTPHLGEERDEPTHKLSVPPSRVKPIICIEVLALEGGRGQPPPELAPVLHVHRGVASHPNLC